MKFLSPKIHAALFTLAFSFSSSLTLAQTVWTDATGDWFTAGNWSAGVPNSATDAQVNNGGTAQVGATGAAAKSLTLGLNAADSGTVSVILGSSLSVTNQIIVGDAGTGAMNVTDGSTVLDTSSDIIGNGGTGTVTVGAGST
jgi:T5SS/PEP-CTERM-associated repeat protein